MGAAGGNVQLTGSTDVETCLEKEDRPAGDRSPCARGLMKKNCVARLA